VSITKRFWLSVIHSMLGIPQAMYTVHWIGPMRHIPGARHCTPCPVCDVKNVYGEPYGLPFWKARRLQRRITGPWDETGLREVL
jgi:hypothetical protein